MRYNIAISGVGGLGILTLGRLFSRAAMLVGKKAIMSEIHGLAQRYGAVFVHVRISDGEILAPTIPNGEADLLVALEPIESLRVWGVIGKRTKVILNANIIKPPTVAIGIEAYPDLDGIIDSLRERAGMVLVFDALKVAEKYGDPRIQNTVLLGVASKIMDVDIPESAFIEAIRQEFSRKKKVLDMNIKAFKEGRSLVKE